MTERGLPFDVGAREFSKGSRLDHGKGRNRERSSGKGTLIDSRDVHSRFQVSTGAPVIEPNKQLQKQLAVIYTEVADLQSRASQIDEFLIGAGYPGDDENEKLRAERVADLEKANVLMRNYQSDTDEPPLLEQLVADKKTLDEIRERFAVAALELSGEIDQLQIEENLVIPEGVQALLVQEDVTPDKGQQESGVDAEPESILALLETKLDQWIEIRRMIDEAAGAPQYFDQLMAELPVVDLAKKHELKKKKTGIGLAKRELSQEGKFSDPEWIAVLERDLNLMIPAGEALLGRLKNLDATVRIEPGQNEDGVVPAKKLNRAVALLSRWDELRHVVGEKQLLQAVQDKHPDMELPHVRTMGGWVERHREPKSWKGRLMNENQDKLAGYLTQLEGIVGDAEMIAADLQSKATVSRAESESIVITFEEAMSKLGELIRRWNELTGIYGDAELREMIFQDRQGEFPPVRDIAIWFQEQSKQKEWESSEKDRLVSNAFPSMEVFIARAEAAALKLETKRTKEGEGKNAPETVSDPGLALEAAQSGKGGSGQETTPVRFADYDRDELIAGFEGRNNRAKIIRLQAAHKSLRLMVQEVANFGGLKELSAAVANLSGKDLIHKSKREQKERELNTLWQENERNNALSEDIDLKALFVEYHDVIVAAEAVLEKLRANPPKEVVSGGSSEGVSENPGPGPGPELEAELQEKWRAMRGRPEAKVAAVETLLAEWKEVSEAIRKFSDETRVRGDIVGSGLESHQFEKVFASAENEKKIETRLATIRKNMAVNSALSDEDAGFLTANFHNYHQLLAAARAVVRERERETAVIAAEETAEGNPENNPMPKQKFLEANELIAHWRGLCDEFGVIRLRKAIWKKYPRPAELPVVPDIDAWLEKHREPKVWRGHRAQWNQDQLDAHLIDLTGLVKDAEFAAADIRSRKAERAAAEEKKEDVKPETRGNVTVLATGRPIESDTEMTAWEMLSAEKTHSFKRLISMGEFNDFQKRLRTKLSDKNITNSVDRLRVAQVALNQFMPEHIRKLAKDGNIEITDEEIENVFMVGLRKNLLVS